MTKTIVGIDYSMTSPGLCVMRPGKVTFIHAFCSQKVERTKLYDDFHFSIKPGVETYASQIERFDKLARKVIDVLNTYDLSDVAFYMEGYSMGSKGKVFHIAENAGVLKLHLYYHGIIVNEVAPTAIKKFATGKGNAKKEDMHDAFMKQTGIDLKGSLTPNRKLGSPVTDLIDAYYVAAFGKQEQSSNEKHQEGGKP